MMETCCGPWAYLAALAVLSLALHTDAYPRHRGSNLQLGQYVPPGLGDIRSPCPGFNTMANHGVFPRNGSAIPIPVIVDAFAKFFGFSRLLTTEFAAGALALGVGDPVKRTIDLEQLRAHNKIEHDASLVRDDFARGNSYLVNHTLVDELVATSQDNATISLHDVGRFRRARYGFCESSNPTFTFGAQQEVISFFEASFLLLSFANVTDGGRSSGSRVPIPVLRQFLQEERYPHGFRPVRHHIGVHQVVRVALALKAVAGAKS